MQVSWAWSRWASPLHVRAGGRSRRPRRRELASSQRAVRRRRPPPTSGGKSSVRRRRRRPTGSRSVLQEPERSSLQQAAVEPQTQPRGGWNLGDAGRERRDDRKQQLYGHWTGAVGASACIGSEHTRKHGGTRDPAGQYDDGSAGTLTISCRISNAEPGRFEGVTASKGFVDFWNRVTSPTLFHVLN